jgi:DNA-binding XRE family transcriptional regulator
VLPELAAGLIVGAGRCAEGRPPAENGERKMSFGATLVLRKLRQLREKAGVTQQQLATATGLPLQDVVSIEQGRTKVQMSTATAIANALKISLVELLK